MWVMRFSPRFRLRRATKDMKQSSICDSPFPTQSRVSSECPVHSIPASVVVEVQISVNWSRLCVFESAWSELILEKAMSTWLRDPMKDSLPAILYINQSSKSATGRPDAVMTIWREFDPTYLQFVEQRIAVRVRLRRFG